MTQTNGTIGSLQERLNEPQTAAALNRLLDRIDTLEQAVTTLTDAVQQAPGMVGMLTDTVDESIQKASQSGVNMDERLHHGLALLTQLTEPRTSAVLSKLLGQLDQLEQLVALSEQAPSMVAMVGDIVDNTYRDAALSGVDIEGRAASGIQMLGKLTEPKTVEVLSSLLDRTDQLQQLAALADQAPSMVAMVGDIVDDTYRKAAEAGIDIETMIRSGADATMKLNTLMESEAFNTFMDSEALAPESLAIVGKAATALAEAQNAPERKVGLLGLMSALKDADVQRTVGFLMNFAKHFGQVAK